MRISKPKIKKIKPVQKIHYTFPLDLENKEIKVSKILLSQDGKEKFLFYIENFLSPEEIPLYESLLTPTGNGKIDYRSGSQPTQNLEPFIKNKIEKIGLKFNSLASEITHTNSNKPIERHVDVFIEGYNYKLGIYLNTIENGGTLFYDSENKAFHTPSKAGNAFLFDISLPHSSEFFQGQIKKLLGFRLNLSV